MKIILTGCAGFIGFHLAKKLLSLKSNTVIGIDNIDNYYDIKIKKDRLKILKKFKNFHFYKTDICKKKI
jgi:UDP-glucuronate 4-epimerase